MDPTSETEAEGGAPPIDWKPNPANGKAVQGALDGAQGKLSDGPMTKPEDALAALELLSSLLPGQQSMAMQQLDPQSFGTLLQEVPPEERVKMESLVTNTHDPKRKLQLWAEFQKSKTDHEVEDAQGKLGGSDDDREKSAGLYNAGSTNDREVDDEVAQLLKKPNLSEKEVQTLMDRKAKERELELKYGINLTYDSKETDPAKRRTWTPDDLAKLDKQLAALPPDQKAFEVEKYVRGPADAGPSGGGVTIDDKDLNQKPGAMETDVAVARAQHEMAAPDLNAEEAAKASKALTSLPPEKQEEAVKKLAASGDLTRMLESMPADKRHELETLTENTKDPSLKFQLWQVSQKGRTERLRDEAKAALGTSADDVTLRNTLDRAATGDLTEIDEEVANLKSKGLSTADFEAEAIKIMARKEHELQVELRKGVNLTNDSLADIAAMSDTADHVAKDAAGNDIARKREVWEDKDLDWVDKQLDMVPPEHRHKVREWRRATEDFKWQDRKDSSGAPVLDAAGNPIKDRVGNGALAQHHGGGDGGIEIFNAGLDRPGSLIHELGHNVDMHLSATDPASAYVHYMKNVGFQHSEKQADFKTMLQGQGKSATEAQAIIDQVNAQTLHGGYDAKEIEVDGKVYTSNSKGWTTFNAKRLPGRIMKDASGNPIVDPATGMVRRQSEITTDKWSDEQDYSRTGEADMFAEHYKLAARDPLRVYSDYVDRPNQLIEEAKANVAAEIAKGGVDPATLAKLNADVDQAEKDAKELKEQYECMRQEIYGVTDKKVEDTAAALPKGADVAAFKEQAARCSTPDQLAELEKLYRSTDTDPMKRPVDKTMMDGAMNAANGLPPEQQAAYKRDLAMCFTPDQVDFLYKAYANHTTNSDPAAGKRHYDPLTHRMEWDFGQKGESTLIGY